MKLIVIILALSIFAAPKIDFDSLTFNYGTILEGKNDYMNHSFELRNVGNKTIKIDRVKASCGCTVVDYDKTIKPGQSGKVGMKVNIKGAKSGTLRKSITIYSNAKNKPVLSLSLEALVQNIINISKNFIRMKKEQYSTPLELLITTKKADLEIQSVEFKSNNKNEDIAIFDLPIFVNSRLEKKNINENGYSEYILLLSLTGESSKRNLGEFIIKTNHEDKPTIKIRGLIE